ncbi:MAG: PIG-L family deacetylase [Aphanocapsa sp. GSE-SYN-MK-11-07L]|jgi:LmbE family N-acetylglucosaminyl deacetylase|nr:PIG-L family deacetylase [Aphanocapsa sp. GSE-SYN-MK-11-07L]
MTSTIHDSSPLAKPLKLPLSSIAEIAAEPVLVVAPHPDDETLGCAGAIALLRARGYTVQILVVSDGAQSHPNSQKFPAPVLTALRAAETDRAMAILGVESDQITFLELPDGAVPHAEAPGFEAAVSACYTYLKTVTPKLVFAPWRSDPHPDHQATWQILTAALAQAVLSPRVLEYPIWDWDPQQRQLSSPDFQAAWRLDIAEVVTLKQQAISAYCSQTTDLIDDDPTGFRLSAQMLENFAQSWEIYLERNP